MMRSVAAMPMSAEISSSSSASMVSTSSGRPAVRLVCPADDRHRTCRQSAVWFGKAPLANAAEDTHRVGSYVVSVSERCRRSISARGGADVVRPSRTAAICVAIGSSTCGARRARARAPVVRTPSATIFMLATNLLQRRPCANSIPTCRFRLTSGAGQHEIAEATQPGRRLPPAASGGGQPGDLSKPARDERGERIVTEPEPSTTPAAIAMTFFSAPQSSTPTTSPTIQPEGRSTKLGLDTLERGVVVEAASTAVGRCCATSRAKLGPDSTATA